MLFLKSCPFLALGLAGAGFCFFLHMKGISSIKRVMWFALFLCLAIGLLYWPLFFNEKEGGFCPFCNSLHSAFRVFTLECGIKELIDDYQPLLKQWGWGPEYVGIVHAIIYLLLITAPILTIGAIVSLFGEMWEMLRLHFHPCKDIYFFSALTVRTLALAEDIKKHPSQNAEEKSQPSRSKKPILVFCGVDREQKQNSRLVEEARKLKAIVLSKEISSIKVRLRRRQLNWICAADSETLGNGTTNDPERKNIDDALSIKDNYESCKKLADKVGKPAATDQSNSKSAAGSEAPANGTTNDPESKNTDDAPNSKGDHESCKKLADKVGKPEATDQPNSKCAAGSEAPGNGTTKDPEKKDTDDAPNSKGNQEQCEKEKVEHQFRIYVVSHSTESQLLFSSDSQDENEAEDKAAHQQVPLIMRRDIARSIVWDYLYNYGSELFKKAVPVDGRKEKNINALVIGLGREGTLMLQTLAWVTQISGYHLDLDVLDEDPLAESKIKAMCPELLSPCHNHKKQTNPCCDAINDVESLYWEDIVHNMSDRFDAEYDIDIHSGINLDSFEFDKKIRKIDKQNGGLTFVFVSLDSDEKNISMAMRLPTLLVRHNPDIVAVVKDKQNAEKLKTAMKSAMEEDKQNADKLESAMKSENIKFIGSIKDVWKKNLITKLEFEEKGLDIHKSWGKEEDFWGNEYNYRSSCASAIYEHITENLPMQSGNGGESNNWQIFRDKGDEKLKKLKSQTEEEKKKRKKMKKRNKKEREKEEEKEKEKEKEAKLEILTNPELKEARLSIAIQEHARWNAYMRSEGWQAMQNKRESEKDTPSKRESEKDTPSKRESEKDTPSKRHPCLVPFDQLFYLDKIFNDFKPYKEVQTSDKTIICEYNNPKTKNIEKAKENLTTRGIANNLFFYVRSDDELQEANKYGFCFKEMMDQFKERFSPKAKLERYEDGICVSHPKRTARR